MILKSLFSRKAQTVPVRSVYESIVARSRQPELYARLGVPDTLDGRFDMIVLHTDAVMRHMQAGDDADRVFAQELIDEVFRDMDRSLREMGVGDMGVGKRVKKMATVYYGRADAYARALPNGEPALREAILRNVYGGDEACRSSAGSLAGYALRLFRHVEALPRSAIRGGELDLSAVEV